MAEDVSASRKPLGRENSKWLSPRRRLGLAGPVSGLCIHCPPLRTPPGAQTLAGGPPACAAQGGPGSGMSVCCALWLLGQGCWLPESILLHWSLFVASRFFWLPCPLLLDPFSVLRPVAGPPSRRAAASAEVLVHVAAAGGSTSPGAAAAGGSLGPPPPGEAPEGLHHVEGESPRAQIRVSGCFCLKLFPSQTGFGRSSSTGRSECPARRPC